MEAGLAEPISPELVLVCPELRAGAIAALQERERVDPVCARPAAGEYELMRSMASTEPEPDERWVAPLPVAILAYAATSATRLAIEASALVAVLVAVLSIVAVLHF